MRTPLVDALRRAIRLAACEARRGPRTPPLDELVELVYSRRRFLGDAVAVTAAMLTGGCGLPALAEHRSMPTRAGERSQPRIAIVGAGIAGLNAAYRLQQAGLAAKLFEGSSRTGGRIFTARDLLADGLTTELGGEFIDSTHEELLALVHELGLERLDTLGPSAGVLNPETYFVDGRHYTQAQAARAFVPLAARILKDYDSLGDIVDYRTEGGGGAFDRMTMAQYFNRIGAKGWMRELFETAYVTEYGLDVAEQSALNFLFLIGTGDLADPHACALLGASDERYKVRGGNQQITDELARRLEPGIHRLHRLEAIRSRGRGYTLTFEREGRVMDEHADIVLLAIPFSILREVKIAVELPPLKRRAIRELGYGANAKVLIGFRSRPWERQGYAGDIYSDETFQVAWANSYLQAGTSGGLTLYSGGKLAHDAGRGTPEELAARLMRGIERAYPGVSAERNDKVARFHWPTFAWTKGSYSCYRPGQWTTIAGSEGLPVDNLFFAGEHCSYHFQGYMNGAAQSGADAARAIIHATRGVKAARSMSRRDVLAA